jgi:hypothetical protein
MRRGPDRRAGEANASFVNELLMSINKYLARLTMDGA